RAGLRARCIEEVAARPAFPPTTGDGPMKTSWRPCLLGIGAVSWAGHASGSRGAEPDGSAHVGEMVAISPGKVVMGLTSEQQRRLAVEYRVRPDVLLALGVPRLGV